MIEIGAILIAIGLSCNLVGWMLILIDLILF